MKTDTLIGTIISTNEKDFVKDSSARETARWKGALDKLVSWGWIKAVGRNGKIFEVTDVGYRKADILKEGMQIDTSVEPIEELNQLDVCCYHMGMEHSAMGICIPAIKF